MSSLVESVSHILPSPPPTDAQQLQQTQSNSVSHSLQDTFELEDDESFVDPDTEVAWADANAHYEAAVRSEGPPEDTTDAEWLEDEPVEVDVDALTAAPEIAVLDSLIVPSNDPQAVVATSSTHRNLVRSDASEIPVGEDQGADDQDQEELAPDTDPAVLAGDPTFQATPLPTHRATSTPHPYPPAPCLVLSFEDTWYSLFSPPPPVPPFLRLRSHPPLFSRDPAAASRFFWTASVGDLVEELSRALAIEQDITLEAPALGLSFGASSAHLERPLRRLHEFHAAVAAKKIANGGASGGGGRRSAPGSSVRDGQLPPLKLVAMRHRESFRKRWEWLEEVAAEGSSVANPIVLSDSDSSDHPMPVKVARRGNRHRTSGRARTTVRGGGRGVAHENGYALDVDALDEGIDRDDEEGGDRLGEGEIVREGRLVEYQHADQGGVEDDVEVVPGDYGEGADEEGIEEGAEGWDGVVVGGGQVWYDGGEVVDVDAEEEGADGVVESLEAERFESGDYEGQVYDEDEIEALEGATQEFESEQLLGDPGETVEQAEIGEAVIASSPVYDAGDETGKELTENQGEQLEHLGERGEGLEDGAQVGLESDAADFGIGKEPSNGERVTIGTYRQFCVEFLEHNFNFPHPVMIYVVGSLGGRLIDKTDQFPGTAAAAASVASAYVSPPSSVGASSGLPVMPVMVFGGAHKRKSIGEEAGEEDDSFGDGGEEKRRRIGQ
ncbi:hypothetical protein HDU93_000560 [Gonapodya sp. JEL0774]|nr:hypothetical protein HDU93_000560 [Gonapodya sp. JEL0774]